MPIARSVSHAGLGFGVGMNISRGIEIPDTRMGGALVDADQAGRWIAG